MVLGRRVQQGANGFVDEVSGGLILKSTLKARSDNLMYEFFAGKYINSLCARFPCFVKTVGLFVYKNDGLWQKANSNRIPQGTRLTDFLDEQTAETFEFKEACLHPRDTAILVERVRDAQPLADVLANSATMARFVELYLLDTLLQVYLPLAEIADTFTHYDLHPNNVLITHTPVHFQNADISFGTNYTAKIIDYGRCFFRDDATPALSSLSIFDRVCKTQSCNDAQTTGVCGQRVGFAWLHATAVFDPKQYFINSSFPNKSHDLRLLHILKEPLGELGNAIRRKSKQATFPRALMLERLCNAVVYESTFGTPPHESSDNMIRNVHDAARALLVLKKSI